MKKRDNKKMTFIDIEELAVIYAKEDGIYYEYMFGSVTDAEYEKFIEEYIEFHI